MRSHSVCEAVKTVGRFQLCHLAAQATRKLHKPGNRLQDTATDALQRVAAAELKAHSEGVTSAILRDLHA